MFLTVDQKFESNQSDETNIEKKSGYKNDECFAGLKIFPDYKINELILATSGLNFR